MDKSQQREKCLRRVHIAVFCDKKADRIIQAIEQGIIFDSTRDRLAELEKQKSELDVAILEEQIERRLLTQ